MQEQQAIKLGMQTIVTERAFLQAKNEPELKLALDKASWLCVGSPFFSQLLFDSNPSGTRVQCPHGLSRLATPRVSCRVGTPESEYVSPSQEP